MTVMNIDAGGVPSTQAQAGLTSLFYLAIIALTVVAIHGARRYRLSRSSLRGIRFSFHGALGEYFVLVVKGVFLSVLTLGFYLPYFASQRRAYLVNNVLYGSEPFQYDGAGRDLLGAYLKSVLLTIPTLGLCWVWYRAFEHRYFWEHTTMRQARFASAVTGGEMLKLFVTNVLLTLVTVGLAAPWAVVRAHTYFTENVELFGSVDWTQIQQPVQRASATPEGLAEAFDLNVEIGM